MPLEDLERDGMLLPREKWGTADLHTRVPRLPLLAVAILAGAGCTLMYIGDGHTLTWIGLGAFLAALAAFTVISLRAIR